MGVGEEEVRKWRKKKKEKKRNVLQIATVN